MEFVLGFLQVCLLLGGTDTRWCFSGILCKPKIVNEGKTYITRVQSKEGTNYGINDG